MNKMDVITEKLQLSFLHLSYYISASEDSNIITRKKKRLILLDTFNFYGNLASYINQSLQVIEDFTVFTGKVRVCYTTDTSILFH